MAGFTPEKAKRLKWTEIGCYGVSLLVLLLSGTASTFLHLGETPRTVLEVLDFLALLVLDAGLIIGVVRTRKGMPGSFLPNLLRVLVFLAVTVDTIAHIVWAFS